MTYTTLLAQVAAWLNRTDLTAVIPDFVTLTEERINRTLRVRQMETALASTPIVSNVITPPAGTIDVKTLRVNDNNDLTVQSYEAALRMQSDAPATLWAWKGTDLYFNGSGDVSGVLYTQIPALETASTNWLSDLAPSAYLFGCLTEAALYTGGDAATWEGRFQAVLNDLQSTDKRYNGPLVARAR